LRAYVGRGVPPMKRVLLVDDHDLFRRMLAVVLEQHTDLKEDVHAESLAEARSALSRHHGDLDVAVVDLDLPEGEATELVRELRALGVPVLGIVGPQAPERRERALRAGAGEVLRTDSTGDEIVGAVKRLVG
jgi:DNA-binding NarL/FixJ family response regulator